VSNRWLRFALALIAIAAIAAAGYRIFQDEQHLIGETRALTAGAGWADTAIETVGEIKASLHAYVAPGQGHDFWTSRARTQLDKLRGALLELDRSTTSVGASLTATLDLSDRLSAAEQRAREYARANQPLLAGDVIFADARDQLDAIRLQVASARGLLEHTADVRHTAIRKQQLMLAVGGAAIAVLGLLILVPPVAARTDGAVAGEPGVAADPRELDEYARVVPTPKSSATATPAPPAKPAVVTPSRTATAAPSTTPIPPRPSARSGGPASLLSAEVMAARSAAGLDPSHRLGDSTAARVTPSASPRDRTPPETPSASRDWPEAAALCTDIARVSDSQDVAALLARAAGLLHASGIVLWMASEGGHELAPAAAAGYDDRLLSRMGTISREADNLTAAAFRDAVVKISPSRGDAAAALAVPLITPAGPAGVLSAELRDAGVDPPRQAIATILAAQLSMLLGSVPATESRKHGTDD
jgi:hypothetical protein